MMKRTDTISELKSRIASQSMHPSGFVPTMGALHKGHIELVRRAVNECSQVIVSIFVNPTQFNDPDDLARYPRTLESDLGMLGKVLGSDDLVFLPTVNEIYPEPDTRKFDFGSIEKVMEGKHRPGHFNGVAQVVSRLFDIVNPDVAYFGRKDLQQVAVIREMVRQTRQKVRIVACPTVREEDGLAMSSRNTLLEPAHRRSAGIIYHSLLTASEIIRQKDIAAARSWFRNSIEKVDGFRLQYFEVVEDNTMTVIKTRKSSVQGVEYSICVALYAGKIRLIDNIPVSLE
jgi:pantoate--beta-alanine ligase